MKEVWKPYPENARFLVSNLGNIYDNEKKKFCIQYPINSRYLVVNTGKHHQELVHRVVAKTFMPIENEKKSWVDHLDCNRHNNCVDNLEWVSPKENTVRTFKRGRGNTESARKALAEKSLKPVNVYDIYGNLVKTFPSLQKAAESIGVSSSKISNNVNGISSNTNGYIVRFVNPEDLGRDVMSKRNRKTKKLSKENLVKYRYSWLTHHCPILKYEKGTNNLIKEYKDYTEIPFKNSGQKHHLFDKIRHNKDFLGYTWKFKITQQVSDI